MTQLELRYERLDELIPKIYDKNPKEHDIGSLCQSITKHGFREPMIYDITLDAIAAGNGRAEALGLLYQDATADTSKNVPGGILTDTDGMWLVPVIYGVASENLALALAYLVDSNNLVMAGGNFTALDMSRAWDMGGYMALLEQSLAHTITIDTDDYLLMLQLAKGGSLPDTEPTEPPSDNNGNTDDYVYYRVPFITEADLQAFTEALKTIPKNEQGDYLLGLL